MSTASLHAASVRELIVALDNREISSTELTRYFLARSVAGKRLNAYLEIFEEFALAQAKSADDRRSKGGRGPLLGIPIAVKDNIVIEGQIASCASKMLANFRSPYDSTAVSRLKKAGAVIIGRTNMDEFAFGTSTENSAFGPAKNPWRETHVPGGTSGGSAAVVAARLAPVALGSDTGGSVRQPGSFCNVIGFKPTYGRVSRYGLVAYGSSLDQIGVLASTANDALDVLHVIGGHDRHDATSMDVPLPDLPPDTFSVRGFRIGIPKQYFLDGLNDDVARTTRAALSVLEAQGAVLVPIELPHTEYAVATYYIIAPAEASSNLARFDGVRYGHRASDSTDLLSLFCRSRAEGFGPEVKRRILIGSYVLSAGYYDAYYVRAQKVRQLVKRDFEAVLGNVCDVIACPTAPNPAFQIGEKVSDPLSLYLEDIFTVPASLAGLPAVSVPVGFSADKLPIGLQLIGPVWSESKLVATANEVQRHLPVYKEVPTEWNSKLS